MMVSVKSQCARFNFLAAVLLTVSAEAQLPDRSVSLPPADVDELDAASAAHLENAQRFLAERQWSEAVDAIRHAQENVGERLIRVDLVPFAGFERYISARQFCQWRLAALATEAPLALEHYRRLVDPLAESWFREGEKNNDQAILQRVIDEAFASRWADESLLKLGNLALARGDYASARTNWQQISAALAVSKATADGLRSPQGSPLWLPLRRFDFAAHGSTLASLLNTPAVPSLGVYPDSDLDLAAVRARLVVASIFEGARDRAAVELSLFKLLHPDAKGRLGGRSGRYIELLQGLWEESVHWPASAAAPGWSTFGGNAARNKTASKEVDLTGLPLWSYPLPRLTAEREVIGGGGLRVAEDETSLLSYHPIVVEGKVIVRLDARGNSYVVALDLKTGKPFWQVDYGRGLTTQATPDDEPSDKPWETSDAHAGLPRYMGVARYMLSTAGQNVFVRTGSPITVPTERRASAWLAKDQGYLVGLDMTTQGKPLEGFPIFLPSNEWSFEGAPLGDEGIIYVAMRRVAGSRSELHIAAFERKTSAAAQSEPVDETVRPVGRLKWRTHVCTSATSGGGQFDELTHLLLTMDSGRIYLNTSAGAVAAIAADDGRIVWVVKYPRSAASSGSSEQTRRHHFRDLTPCMAWRDLIIAAPADCERVFALEAATGQIAWSLPPGAADDIVHLLGVADDVLLASGDYLYWIDVHTGRLLAQFPHGTRGGADEAAPTPRGLGRGLIAGTRVWWPTRESIFVFEARPVATDFGHQPRLVREIDLTSRSVTGGNLVIADGVLLVATGNLLVAFGE